MHMKRGNSIDAVIDRYKKDVDVTLLKENLKLTPAERLKKLEEFTLFINEARQATNRVSS